MLLAYLTLPVSFGLAVTADLVVRIVLGPQWDAVVVPLQLLSFYAAFYSCQVLNAHVLLWTGQFRANMWLNVLAAVLLPIAFYIGAQQGLPGVAWSWVIAFALVNVPAFVIRVSHDSHRYPGLGEAIWPALGACLAMYGAVLALRGALPHAMPRRCRQRSAWQLAGAFVCRRCCGASSAGGAGGRGFPALDPPVALGGSSSWRHSRSSSERSHTARLPKNPSSLILAAGRSGLWSTRRTSPQWYFQVARRTRRAPPLETSLS
jgi:hypothetical protein